MKYLILFSIFLISYSAISQDTITTSSGLKYIVLKKGTGIQAQAGKEVKVHYTGWLTTGTKFDSSRDRNTPFSFNLGKNEVIKGWDEGLLLMKEGDGFRLIIPPELGYGERGAGNIIPPGATLIFDVELLSVRNMREDIKQLLSDKIKKDGIDDAINFYNEELATNPEKYNLDEAELNMLGYMLLSENKKKEAIKIFKLNVKKYPGSFNVYDSLGEAYYMNGDMKRAKSNYNRSLKLNPDNTNAVEMLKKIEDSEN